MAFVTLGQPRKQKKKKFKCLTEVCEKALYTRDSLVQHVAPYREVNSMSVDYIEYEDYTAQNETVFNFTATQMDISQKSETSVTLFLVAVNITICVMGLGGNSLVIWICGWKMNRTVTTTWYISLAVSNLLFCAFLPLEVIYVITSNWPFGQLLCKSTSSVLFINMYSSVFLLVLITADRCVMVSFPVWARNHRTLRKATGIVVLMWALSALLSVPSLVFRQTVDHGSVTLCRTVYLEPPSQKAVVLTRFICGFILPFLAILFCSSVLCVKLRDLTLRSTKPYRVIAALGFSFFVCWVPYHTFVLLELDWTNQNHHLLHTGLKVGTTIAAANSFISPVLYIFIGDDFKATLRKSLLSRIEEAMLDDFL